jgi:hypothetical protein
MRPTGEYLRHNVIYMLMWEFPVTQQNRNTISVKINSKITFEI